MTIHQEGRNRIPVKVQINREEETIQSTPLSRHHHHQMETFYDFKAVILSIFPFSKPFLIILIFV